MQTQLTMNPAIRVTALLIGIFLAAGSLAAERSFSSLEERMTGREFTDSGLHKLTPEELEALNRWIRQRSLAEYDHGLEDRDDRPTAAVEDRRGLPEPRTDRSRDRIESRIVGRFSGWAGDQEFELENGMVWRQTGNDTFQIPEVENPEVVIRPAMMGSWMLQVAGYNQRTRVERVR